MLQTDRRSSRNDSDNEASPDGLEVNSDSDNSGPLTFSQGHSTHRYDSDSDASPVRKARYDSDESSHSQNVKSKQSSSMQNTKQSVQSRRQDSQSNSDQSPRRRGKQGGSDSDQSPPRKRVKDSDSDQTPPRKGRQDSDSDQSLPRKGRQDSDSDQSLPRKGRQDSDSDQSPPRKSHSKSNKQAISQSDKKHLKTGNHGQEKKDRTKKGRVSRFDSDKPEKDEKGRAVKTLSGQTAGLSSAQQMRAEAVKIKEREDKVFNEVPCTILLGKA